MIRIILPILLIVFALGISVIFTQPFLTAPAQIDPETDELSGGVMALLEEKETFATALDNARALKERINELDVKLSAISDEQIRRLDAFLPDEVDEIQLIVDVNNIASRSGMKISDVSTNWNDDNDSEADGDGSAVESLTLSFKVAGSYGQLRSFIKDIAQSLRIMDVESISFSLDEETAVSTYDITLVTYWLK